MNEEIKYDDYIIGNVKIVKVKCSRKTLIFRCLHPKNPDLKKQEQIMEAVYKIIMFSK